MSCQMKTRTIYPRRFYTFELDIIRLISTRFQKSFQNYSLYSCIVKLPICCNVNNLKKKYFRALNHQCKYDTLDQALNRNRLPGTKCFHK